MKKSVLRKYANLIAVCGANVQKGQEVFIRAGLDQPEFIKMLVEECYKCGARKVVVDWEYQPLTKVNVRYRSVKELGKVEDYEEQRYIHYTKNLPCQIYIESDDPDGLNGINQKKMAAGLQKRYPVIKPYRDAIENKDQWCIAAVPGVKWAKKLFPDLPKGQAVEKLWEYILKVSRIDDDPVAAWKEHNAEIGSRCSYLNSLKIKSLHYTSKNGTDLTVGLIPNSVFRGGCDKNLSGIVFNANIPTEECFISPKAGEAEGIVYSTKPLCYKGQLIENFWIKFHDGKAVEWFAEKNNELLTQIIGMDENSGYLGECALVPYDSPIRECGILFYSTLIDENAACHLALGEGFPDTIDGYENYTLQQCRDMGVNDSMIHEDFMIGSEDLSIDAVTAGGDTVAIFRNGTWAF